MWWLLLLPAWLLLSVALTLALGRWLKSLR